MRGKAHLLLGMAAAIFASLFVSNAATSASYQDSLTGPQIIALRNALTGDLSKLNAQKYNSPMDKDAALIDLIKSVAAQSIHSNGISSAGAVTSEIIAVADRSHVPANDVGRALGAVAVQISPCSAASNAADCDSAKQIAQTVANEGTGAMVDAFVAAVTGSGGSVDLAAVALGAPQVTSAIPGSVSGHPVFGSYVPPAPPPACGNPSCN